MARLQPSVNRRDLPMSVSSEDFQRLIHQRYSGRVYDGDRDVPSACFEAMIEAARWTPSCYGEEPWRFLIARKKEEPECYGAILETLVAQNHEWAQEAPALIVVAANTRFRLNQKVNDWAGYDTGAAAYAMILQAITLGLVVHPMGGFREEALKEALGIENDDAIYAVMSVGYPKEPGVPQDRKRQPVSRRFFFGAWQKDEEEN
eukprot:g9134.t1